MTTIHSEASSGEIKPRGYAIQCRVTTEDPTNKFIPDYGRLSHYRSASGGGIQLRPLDRATVRVEYTWTLKSTGLVEKTTTLQNKMLLKPLFQ